jgi:transposase
LREGQWWQGVLGRIALSHAPGPGRLDENAATTVERGDGSDYVHGVDLRPSQAAGSGPEGGTPADAAGHRRREKKNDRIDANKICDCLRCDFLPECYMAPTAIRERRRTLRYRNLLVRQMVQMKIKISALLMEAGVSYNKQRLHKAGYFRELLATNPDINEGLKPLLQLCREMVVRLQKTESAMVRSLERDSLLMDRVERLMTIPAVGPITALTWALEVGEVQRFSSIKKAISYCGLCGAEKRSGSSVQRTPLSKQRNKHLQTTLIEAAKMAPRNSPDLAMLYDKEKQKGNANRATLAVARKLVAYLVAVDRRQKEFLTVERGNRTAA